MKAVVQRCAEVSVTADGKPAGKIGTGLLVLLGVCEGDTREDAALMAKKIANLRIFTDADGKMNCSVLQTGGSVLSVSNFTLCADIRKGTRPSFSGAMEPSHARELYLQFGRCLEAAGVPVAQGVFGADMQISLICDGPVTIQLDTDIWNKKKEQRSK